MLLKNFLYPFTIRRTVGLFGRPISSIQMELRSARNSSL
ncbi:hypothetical protein EVA_20544 [gut metagenome]|uniref:Uncharacterized protein n=1 Tax=gut metagenome TaxID=749906 RepID=J9FVE3_9ZZZZ